MTLELDRVTKVVAGRTQVQATNLWPERGTMKLLLGPTLAGKTTQEALDALCAEQDPQVWLEAPGALVARLENENPMGDTVDDDTLIKSWN